MPTTQTVCTVIDREETCLKNVFITQYDVSVFHTTIEYMGQQDIVTLDELPLTEKIAIISRRCPKTCQKSPLK